MKLYVYPDAVTFSPKGLLSASAISDDIEITNIACRSEILLFYCKFCSWGYGLSSFVVFRAVISFISACSK